MRRSARSFYSTSRFLSNKTDFGFKEVEWNEKERLVRNVFSSVANKYDVMNDFMSMGVHRLWKDEFVRMMGISAAAKSDPKHVIRHLDVAGGTGDIAFRALNTMLASPYAATMKDHLSKGQYVRDDEKPIVVCDINPDMLEVGRGRAKAGAAGLGVGNDGFLGFIEGNAEKLPFADESFDIYTIAFGLRNVTNKNAAIAEAYRVLKPGGRFMVLEFSHVVYPVIGNFYDMFSFNVIPMLGEVVAQDKQSYQYLVESIRKFPKQDELLSMIRHEGFACCSFVNFTFGVVAVHTGFKLPQRTNAPAPPSAAASASAQQT